MQAEWEPVLKLYGPLGVIFLLAIAGIVGAARWFKAMMDATLADARRERDAARSSLETQANRFLESLKFRDDIQEKGFDEILRELRNPRRK